MKISTSNNVILEQQKTKNKIVLGHKEFRVKYLSDSVSYQNQKGGNSSIFLLVDLQGEVEDKVIKFCNCDIIRQSNSNRYRRFKREITALEIANKNKLHNVVKIFDHGNEDIEGKKIPFYIMEKAETDLTCFITEGGLIDDTQSKVKLCIDLIKAIQQLHENGIYHRDLKPDNILLFKSGDWKICDLGLVSFRDEDELSWESGLIGPKGWITPEAANRFYTYENESEFLFDTEIDDLSDIFQLGKLFWFIFQSNIPIGRVKRENFRINDDQIYGLLIWMLSHLKRNRPSLTKIDYHFSTLKAKYKI